MNLQEIEKLKSILTQFVMKGCHMQCISNQNNSLKAAGRVVGVGFRPLWSSPIDSKIEKIELNYIDQRGTLQPYSLYNVVGYDIVSYDGENIEDSDHISFDMHVYSPIKAASTEPYDKVRISIHKGSAK
ncbi:hypothetical protein [Defluviitalea saccharophila]|uniref:Uncharacterized protein n=1 Tax=Defluviitalea saccharophila TaxID=879970 RepID=A0ABZ2Y5Q7_9FIRM